MGIAQKTLKQAMDGLCETSSNGGAREIKRSRAKFVQLVFYLVPMSTKLTAGFAYIDIILLLGLSV